MRNRIITAGFLTFLIFVLTPLALILLDLRNQGLFVVSAIVSLVFVGIYVFWGIPRLIVYSIYSIITMLFLMFVEQIYHFPLVMVGTLLFILNPLASFELFLVKRISDEYVLPIRFSLRGSYWPFFSYQKEMKNFYHLPQAKKLYTKDWYLNLRQLSTLLLVSLGVFLFIHSVNLIGNSIYDFDWYNFFIFYVIVIVFLAAYFVFKKGFLSTYRLLSVSIFPPIIYMSLRSDFPESIRFSFAGGMLAVGLIVATIEMVRFYQRVVYDSYSYYDVEKQMQVEANALFEPLVYNETYTLCGNYTIKVTPKQFSEMFHDILVYANFHKFIVTAYTSKQQVVILYAHFHYKKSKRANKFQFYLEQKIKGTVELDLHDDPNKKLYEKAFFHNHNYIVTRAQRLASLLKDLEIESRITIGFIAYFKNSDSLEAFNKEFQVTNLEDLSEDGYLTVSIQISSINVDYVIEEKVREVLLALLMHQGSFVRITVFYNQ